MCIRDRTGDARADFDGLRRFETPGELIPFVDRLLDHLGHADLGCRHLCLGLRCLFATAESEGSGEGEGEYPDVLVTLFHG